MLGRQGSETEPGRKQGEGAVIIFWGLFLTIQIWFN